MSMADTSTGWIVTSTGEVLAYSPGGVTGVAPAPPSEIPASFALMQNYPNPFNPSTAIGFQITDYSLVTLKVYDILGREVATLVNGVKPAGSYSVPWQPHQLASGVYFYRLTARPLAPGTAPFTSTKKMVLLK